MTPRRAALLAAGTVWLPTLLPVVIGAFRDCDHCLWTYLSIAVIVPGMLASVWLQLNGAWFVLAAALPTLVLAGAVYACCRRLSRRALYAVQVLVILFVGFVSVAIGEAVRA
ncbi:MAG: hypothetical protein AB8H80_18655 [Planctomycetota bacterium]